MSGSVLTLEAASRSSPCSAILRAFTGGRSSRMVASPPEECTLTNSATSVAGVVLERQAQPNPEVLDLAVLDRDVLADHFGDPEVAHGGGGGPDRFARGVLPGFLADPDDLGYAVDTHRLSLAVCGPGCFGARYRPCSKARQTSMGDATTQLGISGASAQSRQVTRPGLCSQDHAGPGVRDEEPMPERRLRLRLG